MRTGRTAKQQFWLDHVQDWSSSGLSMSAYADRHGLDVQQFYRRKSQLKTLGVLPDRVEGCRTPHSSDAFIRTCVPETEVPQPSKPEERSRSCAARISLANGITIDVPAGFAPEALSTDPGGVT